MIKVRHKGSFKNFEQFADRMTKKDYLEILNKYGEMGVRALSDSTPKNTGKTAESWGYRIESVKGHSSIYWTNSNEVDGCSIALLLIYGHGTKNGAYVQGIDFANPAIQPLFDKMADEIWKEVTR